MLILLGVAVVVVGFAIRLNPILVVVAAAMATGVAAHMDSRCRSWRPSAKPSMRTASSAPPYWSIPWWASWSGPEFRSVRAR